MWCNSQYPRATRCASESVPVYERVGSHNSHRLPILPHNRHLLHIVSHNRHRIRTVYQGEYRLRVVPRNRHKRLYVFLPSPLSLFVWSFFCWWSILLIFIQTTLRYFSLRGSLFCIWLLSFYDFSFSSHVHPALSLFHWVTIYRFSFVSFVTFKHIGAWADFQMSWTEKGR